MVCGNFGAFAASDIDHMESLPHRHSSLSFPCHCGVVVRAIYRTLSTVYYYHHLE
jgi:hypothetical protein